MDAMTVTTARQQEIDKASNVRMLEKTNFMTEVSSIGSILEEDGTDDILVTELQRDLKLQLVRCKESQATYISLLDSTTACSELSWLKDIQKIYTNITVRSSKYIQRCKQMSKEQRKKSNTGMWLERMKLPRFSNNIRAYPSFKKDFERQVLPEYPAKDTAAFVLKACLSSEALDVVKNVDDDIDEMWRRLDKNLHLK
jgi:hypothetical protein